MATRLETMMNRVNEKVNAYVSAYNDGAKKSVLKGLKSVANDEIKKYNLQLSIDTYRAWQEQGDPVKTAIMTGVIAGAKKLRFRTDDDDKMTATIVDAEYPVDLPQMYVTLGEGVFHAEDWFSKASKLCWSFVMERNKENGDSVTFQYYIDEISKEFAFPAGIDVTTYEGKIMALQMTFDAILFIEDAKNPGMNLIRATGEEWGFIRDLMTYDAGFIKIGVKNTGAFTNLVMRAMYKAINNKKFVLEADDAYKMPTDADVKDDAEETKGGLEPDDAASEKSTEE